jgi:esterase/lipase
MNSQFLGAGTPFSEYIVQTRAMLAQVHTGSDTTARIEGNAPFELHPSKRDGQHHTFRRGILLTHGASDSPYHMLHLAAFFRAQGWFVMSILLPGHGTVPADLLDVRWQEWARAVAYGTNCLAEEVDELYLGGFSLGGTLSVRQSLLDDRVRGLFLFAPALKISPRARFANLNKLYSWLVPSAKWLDILPDRDLYKYESFAKNAAAQTFSLIADTQARLQQHALNIPLFIAASMEDMTVDTRATLAFINASSHPANKLVLYTTEPSAVEARQNVETVNSAVPEQRILSLAHTAIVIAPEDTHYGIAGDYANYLHYFHNDRESFAACRNKPDEVWLGEVTPQNLNIGTLRRLMYNPHFAGLEKSIQRFISSLANFS